MAEEPTLRSFLQLEGVRDRYITDLNTEKQRFSYAELYEEVENLCSFLKSINVQPGEEISIILFNSIEYVVTFLGINYNQNICLPLNTNLKKEEYVKYLVNNCKYIIIHDYDEGDDNYSAIKKKHGYYKNVCKSIEQLGTEYNIGVIRIRKNKEAPFFTYSLSRPCGCSSHQAGMNRKLKEDNGLNKKGNDVCLHLHTSGTTSKVKIVQLTNENIKTTIRNITTSYGLNKEDNTVIVMPLYHVHGLIGVLMPMLYVKGNVLFQIGHSFSASEFWKDVVRHNITYFSAVPTIVKILLLRYDSDYFVDGAKVKHKLRFIRTSSSQLDEHMEREAELKFETNIFQAYGMTEACHQVSTNKLIHTDGENVKIAKKYKSVGIPNVGVVIYNHEKEKVCGKNELGEICINGKNVMFGYKEMKDNENICVHVNTLKEKAEYMEGNKFFVIGESVPFFKTGDVGYVDEENYLFIAGRIKDIINRGGEKIIPNEIDDVVRDDPRVSDCLALGCNDEVYGEAIHAAVILDEKQLPCGEAPFLQKAQPGSFTSGATSLTQSFTTPQHGKPPPENEFNVHVSLSLNLKYHHLREELTEHMKKRLADFKVPKKIYFVNHFLKTDTGKVSRRKMAEGVDHLKKTSLNLFDVLALCLKKAHLDDYIYGLYGIPLNKIIYSFLRNDIYYISFRNEINACLSCSYVNYFDQDKAKKKVGIILTCSGPAFVNALPGLYNAKVNHFPLVLICFENFTSKYLTEFEKHHNFQFFPQQQFLAKAKEMCAGVFHVDSPDAFPEQLYNCVETCVRMKSPVYLNLSYDLLGKEVTLDKALHLLDLSDCYARKYHQPMNVLNGQITLSTEDDQRFNKLLQLFCRIYQSNRRGAIFLGTNCNHGVKYVLKLSHLMKIPIYTNTMAKCFIKENYIYNANQCKSFLFENLDFCFAFGTVYNFYFNFGKFTKCKKENMLCVDLTNDVFDPQVDSHCEHFFFSDLYRVVKQLYFSLKGGWAALSIDVDARMSWVAAIQEAKQKSIHKLCCQVATKHFVSECFTMEQVMLILRHLLLDYFFTQNKIPATYKRYFIDYFKYVDREQLRGVFHEEVLPHGDGQVDQGAPQSDCDISDSSSEEGDQREDTTGYALPNKSKMRVNTTGAKRKHKFLNQEIKKRVVITNEGSITLHLGILYLPQLGPYNFVLPQINGMMGVSMNAAICAALNDPENIVFAILGDSSFGFTSNEVETICRFKLKIVLIILNNNGIYGDRDFQTEGPYFDEVNKDAHFFLHNPSALYHFSKYENYVTAHGGYGCYVDNREDFVQQIKHVMSDSFNSFPVLLNVIVGDARSVKFDVDKYIQ
ncbi:hypothetical protein AK88_02218 [Plasmodium fragile]|uniref:AMP-dependent synthetase/ligase domain-containing protein n=1 Tax=Plasmodium fragile TaxID=5857 RepID=A0A0D9QM59_PLAFR|nr:uncharacterized protein AK88_02218 [Plasmodium fragile]KJP88104.1 hypothetical protein AK88_02218 [Plasmodium fragile]